MSAARSEKISFPGADGSSRLAARLDLPAGHPRAHARCSPTASPARRTSSPPRALPRVWSVTASPCCASILPGSAPARANSPTPPSRPTSATWRRERQAPALLIGHSLGGAAVLAAAKQVPEARAICTIAAPAEPSHVARLFAPALAEIEARGEAEVVLAGRSFRIKKAFLDDIEKNRLAADIAALRRPLLIFHAPRDTVVGIDNASRIFGAAKHPKSFVSLDDADHLLGRREDAAYVADVLAAWAARYLELPAAAEAPAAPADAVVVAEAGTGKFAQVVSVRGRHILAADEPESYGGDDTGPGPYEYLLAGLGACTAMTVRMYADRKGLPLQRVSVTLRHAKVHAEDCADCETKQGMLDRIDREITLEGPLDAAAKAKLLEIADKCPVHRTLHSEVWITTTLKE